MDAEKINDALKTFLLNSYWKGLYENAPDMVKAHYRLMFYYSLNNIATETELSAFKKAKANVEGQMTVDDWQYLIAQASCGQARAEYRKRMLRKIQTS